MKQPFNELAFREGIERGLRNLPHLFSKPKEKPPQEKVVRGLKKPDEGTPEERKAAYMRDYRKKAGLNKGEV